jgi:hypothetical protein
MPPVPPDPRKPLSLLPDQGEGLTPEERVTELSDLRARRRLEEIQRVQASYGTGVAPTRGFLPLLQQPTAPPRPVEGGRPPDTLTSEWALAAYRYQMRKLGLTQPPSPAPLPQPQQGYAGRADLRLALGTYQAEAYSLGLSPGLATQPGSQGAGLSLRSVTDEQQAAQHAGRFGEARPNDYAILTLTESDLARLPPAEQAVARQQREQLLRQLTSVPGAALRPQPYAYDPAMEGRTHFLLGATHSALTVDLQARFREALSQAQAEFQAEYQGLRQRWQQLRQQQKQVEQQQGLQAPVSGSGLPPEWVELSRQMAEVKRQGEAYTSGSKALLEKLEQRAAAILAGSAQVKEYLFFLGRARADGQLFTQAAGAVAPAAAELRHRVAVDWSLASRLGIADRVEHRLPERAVIAQQVLGHTFGTKPELAGPFGTGELKPTDLGKLRAGGGLSKEQREFDPAAAVHRQASFVGPPAPKQPGAAGPSYTPRQQLASLERTIDRYRREQDEVKKARNQAFSDLARISQDYRHAGLPAGQLPEDQLEKHPQRAAILRYNGLFDAAEGRLRDAYAREDDLTDLLQAMEAHRGYLQLQVQRAGDVRWAEKTLTPGAAPTPHMGTEGGRKLIGLGQYGPFTLSQAPVDYLIWISSGARLSGQVKPVLFRTAKAGPADVQLLRPVSVARARYWEKMGDLKETVTDYLRSPEGLGRLQSYWEREGLSKRETGPGDYYQMAEKLEERSQKTKSALNEQEQHLRLVESVRRELGRETDGAKREAISRNLQRLEQQAEAQGQLFLKSKADDRTKLANLTSAVEFEVRSEVEKGELSLVLGSRQRRKLEQLRQRWEDEGMSGQRLTSRVARAERSLMFRTEVRRRVAEEADTLRWQDRYRELLDAGFSPEEAKAHLERFKQEVTYHDRDLEKARQEMQREGVPPDEIERRVGRMADRQKPPRHYAALSFTEDAGEEEFESKRSRDRRLSGEHAEIDAGYYGKHFATPMPPDWRLYFMMDPASGVGPDRRRQIRQYLATPDRASVPPPAGINPARDFTKRELYEANRLLNTRRARYDPAWRPGEEYRRLALPSDEMPEREREATGRRQAGAYRKLAEFQDTIAGVNTRLDRAFVLMDRPGGITSRSGAWENLGESARRDLAEAYGMLADVRQRLFWQFHEFAGPEDPNRVVVRGLLRSEDAAPGQEYMVPYDPTHSNPLVRHVHNQLGQSFGRIFDLTGGDMARYQGLSSGAVPEQSLPLLTVASTPEEAEAERASVAEQMSTEEGRRAYALALLRRGIPRSEWPESIPLFPAEDLPERDQQEGKYPPPQPPVEGEVFQHEEQGFAVREARQQQREQERQDFIGEAQDVLVDLRSPQEVHDYMEWRRLQWAVKKLTTPPSEPPA